MIQVSSVFLFMCVGGRGKISDIIEQPALD
jgi:hypothetical protein